MIPAILNQMMLFGLINFMIGHMCMVIEHLLSCIALINIADLVDIANPTILLISSI